MSQNKKARQTPKSKSSKNTSLSKIAIEVVSIVLGVLLALAVNEWRTQRANQTEAESAMNMSAYAAVLGSEVDDKQFAKNFSDYMNMLLQVEDQLLNSYESALTQLQ